MSRFSRHIHVPSLTGISAAEAAAIASNCILLLLGFLASVITARGLGAAGRGMLAAVLAWCSFAAVTMQFGLPQALTFEAGRRADASGTIASAAVITAIQVLGVLFIGFATVEWLPNHRGIIVWSTGFCASQLVTTQVAAILQGQSRWATWHWVRLLSGCAYPCGAIVAVFVSPSPERVMTFAASGAMIAAALAIVMLYVSGTIGLPRKATVSLLLSYGARTLVGNWANFANAKLDQLLISALLPLDKLGVYAVAVSACSVTSPLPSGIAAVTFSRIAGAQGRDHNVASAANAALARASRATMMAAFCLAASVWILIPIVFGPDFNEASAVAFLLSPSIWILGRNYVMSDALRGIGKPMIVSASEWCGLVAAGVGLALLLPSAGIAGAAIASIVGYLAVHQCLWKSFSRSFVLRPAVPEFGTAS